MFLSKLEVLVKDLSNDQLDTTFSLWRLDNKTYDIVALKDDIGIYTWHSNHHYTHVENILKKKDWI